jgi:hypothetical protein
MDRRARRDRAWVWTSRLPDLRNRGQVFACKPATTLDSQDESRIGPSRVWCGGAMDSFILDLYTRQRTRKAD